MPKKASVNQQLTPTPLALPEISAPILYNPITSDSSQKDVIASDVDLVNAAGNALYQLWNQPHSPKSISSMIKDTIAFTKHRRAVLNMPYGPEKDSKNKGAVVYPVD